MAFVAAGVGERRRGGACARRKIGTGPIDDGDGHEIGELAPTPPAVQLREVIGAHDEDEMNPGETPAQRQHRVVGVAGAERRLDGGDVDRRVSGERAGGFDAFLERRQAAVVLEWIAGRDQPPDAVEAEPLSGEQAQRAVGVVRRIERAAEQTDAHAAGDGRQADVALQGRVCPSPRTRYLKEVSCSTPTGPRACRRPVAMPISRAEAELAAVGELGRGVVQHDGASRLRQGKSRPPSGRR